MTVTLHLPPEKEAAFTALAQARGLSLEQWMLDFADQYIQPVSVAHLQTTEPEEWARYFAPGLTAMIPIRQKPLPSAQPRTCQSCISERWGPSTAGTSTTMLVEPGV